MLKTDREPDPAHDHALDPRMMPHCNQLIYFALIHREYLLVDCDKCVAIGYKGDVLATAEKVIMTITSGNAVAALVSVLLARREHGRRLAVVVVVVGGARGRWGSVVAGDVGSSVHVALE